MIIKKGNLIYFFKARKNWSNIALSLEDSIFDGQPQPEVLCFYFGGADEGGFGEKVFIADLACVKNLKSKLWI